MATKLGNYLCIYMPEHHKATAEGYVREHIVVAENKLGRKLKAGEVVHHLDKNKFNNSPENLIVFATNADHSAFHKGCKAELDGDVYWCPTKSVNKHKICPICNKHQMYYKSKMCSECNKTHGKCYKRKTERPSADELLKLITTFPLLQIGRMYNVSDNTIRKWCKKYNLPYKKNEIDQLKLDNLKNNLH